MSEDMMKEFDDVQAEMSSITTEDLDKFAREYQEKYDEYEAQSKIGKELYKEAELLELRFVKALELAGKSKYHVEGIGLFSFVDKQSVQTPKTLEEKQQLAKYLEENGGKTLFWSMFGINSNTLQSFYKGEFEAWKKKCAELQDEGVTDIPNFGIPGIGAPTNMRSLRLTKEKK